MSVTKEEPVVDGTQIPGALPNVEVYSNYIQRAKSYCINVLLPGGMSASKGVTITAKLKQFLLVTTGKQDLKEITLSQWESLWAQLDALAKESKEKAVAAVLNFGCTCDEQTHVVGATAAMGANAAPAALMPDCAAWLQRGMSIVAKYKLACVEKSRAQWAMGDWLLEVQEVVPCAPGTYPSSISLFPGLVNSVSLAANHYGYAVSTFQELRRVARAFPLPTRVGSLSWKHHQALAAMPDDHERSSWLTTAQLSRWSKTKLQAELAASRAAGLSVPLPPTQKPTYPSVLTQTKVVALEALAKQTGLGLAQVKDLIVSNFLEEPAKVEEFLEAYKSSFDTPNVGGA